FDSQRANDAIDRVRKLCAAFIADVGRDAQEVSVRLSVEARYPNQIWEIEVPLEVDGFHGPGDVERLRQAFHRVHHELFAVNDPGSAVEVVSWHGRASVEVGTVDVVVRPADSVSATVGSRRVLFPDLGEHEASVHRLESLAAGTSVAGPAIVESALATLV